MYLRLFAKKLLFLLIPIFLLSACDEKVKQEYPFTISGSTEGTTYHIKATSLPDKLNIEQLKQQIQATLDEVDGQMSTYKPDSELSRLNQNPSTDWITISTALYTVLAEAQRVSTLSNGAFDVTIGPLVNLWGFGPEPVKNVAPAEAEIQQRLSKVGYGQLTLQEQPLAVKKARSDLYVDLSAIAKGYAVDQAAKVLEQAGVNDYMVEIGGEIRVKGKNIEDKPWNIAIEKPITEQRLVEKVLHLTNIGMATSGDYRNFFEVDGVRFSHTIDPRTGRPITHKLASISVLNDTTMTADAWATALNVLGPDAGYELAEKQNLAALFIIKADDGFTEKPTPAFLKFLGK